MAAIRSIQNPPGVIITRELERKTGSTHVNIVGWFGTANLLSVTIFVLEPDRGRPSLACLSNKYFTVGHYHHSLSTSQHQYIKQ